MPDYRFEGTIDSDGTLHGTLTEIGGDYGGGSGGGVIVIASMVVIYLLSLIGGIMMLSSVASEAPFCIVPAVLGFIIMLIPVIKATGSGNFALKMLVAFYKWSDVLIGLIICMFWLAYISEAVSSLAILAIGFGLMYLNIVTVIRSIHKAGVIGGIITIAVPLIVYLVFLATSNDFPIGYIAIIPTTSICLSLFTSEVVNICNLGYRATKKQKSKPIIRMIAYIAIIDSVFLFSVYITNKKEGLLQMGKDYISEGKYSEAREVLEDLKLEEAKELYASIRYKDIKVGEIVYNGHYDDNDARSVSEDGIKFICLDVVGDKALLISLDVVRLAEQFNGTLEEEFYTENYSLDTEGLVTTTIGKKQSKFFLLSKSQYDKYVKNEQLAGYLNKTKVTSIAKKQKEKVDNDTYKWTTPYIDIWLLNEFTSDNKIGTINVKTGEFNYKPNYKVYAGIRICYYANIN